MPEDRLRKRAWEEVDRAQGSPWPSSRKQSSQWQGCGHPGGKEGSPC